MTFINMKQQVEVTPKLLAEIFCELDGEQQAEFFSQVRRLFNEWEHPDNQLDCIASSMDGFGDDFVKELYCRIRTEE